MEFFNRLLFEVAENNYEIVAESDVGVLLNKQGFVRCQLLFVL